MSSILSIVSVKPSFGGGDKAASLFHACGWRMNNRFQVGILAGYVEKRYLRVIANG